MGKHDMKENTNEFYEARLKELENRLAFAAENNAKLVAEVNKYNKWMSEMEANFKEQMAEKDVRIAKLEATVVELAVLIRSDGSVVYEDGYDPRRYCDIYYCYECPRYGDDCDGKEENRKEKAHPKVHLSNHLKSTPPGIKKQGGTNGNL